MRTAQPCTMDERKKEILRSQFLLGAIIKRARRTLSDMLFFFFSPSPLFDNSSTLVYASDVRQLGYICPLPKKKKWKKKKKTSSGHRCVNCTVWSSNGCIISFNVQLVAQEQYQKYFHPSETSISKYRTKQCSGNVVKRS